MEDRTERKREKREGNSTAQRTIEWTRKRHYPITMIHGQTKKEKSN